MLFIAVGGLLAIVFFFVCAQSIVGSKSIHAQLQKIIEQNAQILIELRRLVSHFSRQNPDEKNNSH